MAIDDGPHLSIGEVITLLQDEFPDVTISKIRFLESQGLLDPERTPSGYRKFYPADIERLRWILRQQKDHFLPLKVIKERLAESDGPEIGGDGDAPVRPRPEVPDLWDVGPAEITFDIEGLCRATGATPRELRDLERFGLIRSRAEGSRTVYDGDAAIVVRLAAAFAAHGVEARHLRAYQVAAAREAGLFEQAVPGLRRRGSAARAEARAEVTHLADLGAALRVAMLRQALDTD